MLNLMVGRAGAGKTALVMEDIRRRMEAGERGLLLVVPEQYSHDAERQLNAVCGDGLSLHGEALSFTGLCNRVFSEMGGVPQQYIDAGGQTAVMHMAVESIAPKLKAYGIKGLRTELLENLRDAVNEFKTHGISVEMLSSAAERAAGALADKLHDISFIYSAYEGLLAKHGKDPVDRLAKLAEIIGGSTLGTGGRIFFDGFNDFTAQELRVIEELLRKKADLTVCLTYGPESADEAFELPRKTAERLRRLATAYGADIAETVVEPSQDGRPEDLMFLESRLFGYKMEKYAGQGGAITIYAAPTRYAECEHAAHAVLELVRAGRRWRDIAVMARDWEEYRSICENVFERYGIPVFSSGRVDAMEKPATALIAAALDIAVSGWEHRLVFRYLKTGLADILADDISELENYVHKWNIRGFLWEREWAFPPAGYGAKADEAALRRLNGLRSRVVSPILNLRRGIKGAGPIGEKLKALYSFLEEIELPEKLAKKAEAMRQRGEARLADENTQLWDIIINAMDRMFEILGGANADAAEFRKLLGLVISQYDIGVIPTSLDRASLGGMAMSRRRDLKCLIILGATDDKLPMLAESGGAFSDCEREQLAGLGVDMPTGQKERISREINMIYSALALPSQKLILTYPSGVDARPSFIVKRIKSLFGVEEITLRDDEHMIYAEAPYRELELMRGEGGGMERGRLSPAAARRLYGEEIAMSPTRADKYYSCPYQHFLHSGLKLAPRTAAEFDAPQEGIFMHAVLEGVAREIKESPGFKKAGESLCRALTAMHIELYVDNVLHGFEGKSARFIYLFKRLEEKVSRIALDMLYELKGSDFVPLDFEFDVSELELGDQGLKGFIDRVDGWRHGDKHYLRVIDYKTGKKSFSLSDIVYGRDMQMLIYLFALEKHGKARYGGDIVPAGALYVPARDIVLQMPRNSTDEQIAKKRAGELRRAGLVLNEPRLLDAMENSEVKRYLPVRQSKDGELNGGGLIDARQSALLDGHVRAMLDRASEEILDGGIECVPYYKNENENACMFCRFKAVCAFDEDAGDTRRHARKLGNREIWEILGNRE